MSEADANFSHPFTATWDVEFRGWLDGEWKIKKWTFSQPELNVDNSQVFSKPERLYGLSLEQYASFEPFFWNLRKKIREIPRPEEYWEEGKKADFWMKPCTPHNAGKTCWRESKQGTLSGVMPFRGHCIAREKTLALFLSAQLLNDEWEPTGSIMSIHELRKMQNDKKKNFSGRYRKIYNCKWAWKGKCES